MSEGCNDFKEDTSDPTDTLSRTSVKAAQVAPDADLKDSDIEFPDGGIRAWLVVLGGVFATFSSFGYVNSWGVFQEYYAQVLLPDVSSATIAWIGSIQATNYFMVFKPESIVFTIPVVLPQYAFIFAFGLLWGRLFDLGIFHLPLSTASLLLVVTTVLIGQCTQYWQFLLCQGIGVGVASGAIFTPVLAVIAHWFKRRRATAYGIVATGSSIGGTIFPIMVQNLIPRVGFAWTMRINGLVLLVALTLINITVRRRLPSVNVAGGFFNLKAFRYMPFTLYVISTFITLLGLYTLLTYIALSAAKAGISPSFDVYLVAIANASSFFGRIISGFASDRIGAISVTAPCTLLAAIATYTWPFVGSLRGLIALCIFYGFASGVYVALIPVPVVHMGETADVGRRSGIVFSFMAIATLIGPPISGQIASRTGGYEAVGFYAGSTITVGVLGIWIVRSMITGHLIKGKF